MDPYLEGSSWMSVHGQLIAEIARQLAPKLRPRYLAEMTERFVLEMPADVAVTTTTIYPDVGVADTGRMPPDHGSTAGVTAPLQLATAMPAAVPQFSVVIRDRANRQPVTAIEVLSPTNKYGEGRYEYLTKRHGLLHSTAHLLEIDLLREGHRLPMQQPLPSVPYFIFLSRAEIRPLTEIWPITLQDRLPVVPVPLLPGDADVLLDVQLGFSTIYDQLGYDLAVDYAQPPEIPLEPDVTTWADQLLRAARLRP
jgi:hypothetical protein